MKCYVCNAEMVSCEFNDGGKKIPAMKCPVCNDDYTIVIDAKYLEETEK